MTLNNYIAYRKKINLHEYGTTTELWDKYGLSVKNWNKTVIVDGKINQNHPHNLVANFLEENQEIKIKYLNKQQGFSYLDILNKIENKKP